MKSCVLIVPAELLAPANALGAAMGWGDTCYSVPLGAEGEVSHYGLHTWVEDSFIAMVEAAAGEGEMPAELVDAGYPAEDFAAVVGSLTASFAEDMTGHFDRVCVGLGLVAVAVED